MKLEEWLYGLPVRLRWLFRRNRAEQELAQELAHHLELEEEARRERGAEPAQAHREARLAFGGVEGLKEESREAQGFTGLESLGKDLLLGLRSLKKSLGFATVSVLSLGLGVGATSALFAVVEAALLSPLDVHESHRLVAIEENKEGNNTNGNPARLRDWQSATSFQGVAGWYGEGVALPRPEGSERASLVRTFGPFFELLSPRLTLGRALTTDESDEGAAVVVLSHRFWQRRFGGDPAVLGQSLAVGAMTFEVVGVLASGQDFPDGADLWAPAPLEQWRVHRRAGFLNQLARLAPGVTPGEAERELGAVAARLAATYPDTDKGLAVRLQPLAEQVAGEARTPLLLLLATLGAVLLVVAVNLAGLQVARGLARQREAALRLALGAGKARLLRQLASESLWIAILGGLLGLLVAGFGLALLQELLPPSTPRLADARLSWKVLAFALATTAASALFFGGLPALQGVRATVATRLKEGGAASRGDGRQRLRSLLVAAQVTISTVLLVAAGLLTTSLLRLSNQPLGFASKRAIAFTVSMPWDTASDRIATYSAAQLEALAALPGVEAVGVVDRLPLAGGTQTAPVEIEGRELPPALASSEIGWRTASPGYFRAAGIPLLAGELFRERPAGGDAPLEALVNERFARVFFGSENPIGREIRQRFGDSSNNGPWIKVVGVVAGVLREPTDTEAPLEVYRPWGAAYWPLQSYVVRASADAQGAAGGTLLAAVQRAAAKVDEREIIENLRPLEDHVALAHHTPRTRAWLVSGLALTALLLSALGLYGLLAYDVTRRTQEIGLRLALGAAPSSLVFAALGRALRLVGAGLVVGLGLALVAGRFVASLLFGIEPYHPESYLSATTLLLVVATAAALLPARKATTVDPTVALRHE